MTFTPNVEILLDAITRRKIPERIPNYEPYYNEKTVTKVIGKPFPEGPYTTKEACRNMIRLVIEYYLTIRSDIISIMLNGPSLPMKREEERTDKEKRDYLTQRDIPTIFNRADYNNYPWPKEGEMKLSDADRLMLETVREMVPQGMGIMVSRSGIFEMMNYMTGYENFCYLLKDDPGLLDEFANRFGEINLKIFAEVAQYDFVNILHMGDDIAYRGGTLVSPELLRKWLFPWMKKYTGIAHKNGKVFTYHSDGNFKAVAEDIIQSGVDGKQAFEEVSYSVIDFKKDYGDRISVLGGIDVDLMARLSEKELRRYVRKVLEICAPGGGYTVGSGNTFATYIPIENYMAMLDEAEAFM